MKEPLPEPKGKVLRVSKITRKNKDNFDTIELLNFEKIIIKCYGIL